MSANVPLHILSVIRLKKAYKQKPHSFQKTKITGTETQDGHFTRIYKQIAHNTITDFSQAHCGFNL
jgi:hypothetical protein